MGAPNTTGRFGSRSPMAPVDISEAERGIASTNKDNIVQKAISGTQFLDKGFYNTQDLLAMGDDAFDFESKAANELQLSRVNRAKMGMDLTNASIASRQRQAEIDQQNVYSDEAERFFNENRDKSARDVLDSMKPSYWNNPLIMRGVAEGARRETDRFELDRLQEEQEDRGLERENKEREQLIKEDADKIKAASVREGLQKIQEAVVTSENDFISAALESGYGREDIADLVVFRSGNGDKELAAKNQLAISGVMNLGKEITEAQAMGLKVFSGDNEVKGSKWLSTALRALANPENKGELPMDMKMDILQAQIDAKNQMRDYRIGKENREAAVAETDEGIKRFNTLLESWENLNPESRLNAAKEVNGILKNIFDVELATLQEMEKTGSGAKSDDKKAQRKVVEAAAEAWKGGLSNRLNSIQKSDGTVDMEKFSRIEPAIKKLLRKELGRLTAEAISYKSDESDESDKSGENDDLFNSYIGQTSAIGQE